MRNNGKEIQQSSHDFSSHDLCVPGHAVPTSPFALLHAKQRGKVEADRTSQQRGTALTPEHKPQVLNSPFVSWSREESHERQVHENGSR